LRPPRSRNRNSKRIRRERQAVPLSHPDADQRPQQDPDHQECGRGYDQQGGCEILVRHGIPLEDNDVNLAGEKDTISAEEKQAILDEWATRVTPLVMRCHKRQFDQKTIYIDPQPLTPDAEFSERYTSRLTAVEV